MFTGSKLTLLLALLLLAPCAMSADFEQVHAAYASGEYQQAYRGFKRLARHDHLEAQYLLGLLYLNGQGVVQSTEQGLHWLKRSAENGYYLAAAELGQIYASGNRVAMDAEEAAKWIELSTRLVEAEDAEEGCD